VNASTILANDDHRRGGIDEGEKALLELRSAASEGGIGRLSGPESLGM